MSQFQQAQPPATGLPGSGSGCAVLFDYNIGDSEGIPFAVTDLSGNPKDLTGWTLTSSCRQSINPPSALVFTKTSGAGITLTNASGGLGVIYPNEVDTKALQPWQTYWIDLVGRDTGLRVQTLILGKFRALPRVTASPA